MFFKSSLSWVAIKIVSLLNLTSEFKAVSFCWCWILKCHTGCWPHIKNTCLHTHVNAFIQFFVVVLLIDATFYYSKRHQASIINLFSKWRISNFILFPVTMLVVLSKLSKCLNFTIYFNIVEFTGKSYLFFVLDFCKSFIHWITTFVLQSFLKNFCWHTRLL